MDRLKERAVVLPIVAFVLLTTPILLIFNSSTLILGIPVLYIYTFSTWALLTIAGIFLTRALQKAEQEQREEKLEEKTRDKNKLKWQLK